MKDYSRQALEASRPDITALEAVAFCLRRLYADRCHKITDNVALYLTYEELIGALLLARDKLQP